MPLSFQENQLHLLVQDLKKSYLDCSIMHKKKRIRNILKLIGIGFLLYKDIDSQILATQAKIESLMKNVYPTSNAFSTFLLEQINTVEKASRFLSKEEETNWITSIESSKSDLNFILALPNQQSENNLALASQLQNAKQLILNYNTNLEKTELRNRLLELKNNILEAEKNYAQLYQRPQYFSKKEFRNWYQSNTSLKDQIENAFNKGVFGLPFQNSLSHLREVFANGEGLVAERNKSFIETEIQKKELFPPVEGQTLTDEQKRAIVVDEANTLVVAGAGTGKTTALLGKAQYLVAKGLASPPNVLIVSFGTEVAKENDSKINDKAKGKFVVKTYHSLGLKIIREATKDMPAVSKIAEDKIANSRTLLELIQRRLKDHAFAHLISDYFLFNFQEYKTIFEFKQQGDYFRYLKNNEIRTLQGHPVRSLEECEIANFLYINGVKYEYEKAFKTQTSNNERMPYRPDFTLTDYDICIEHFGIDRQNNTAPWVNRQQYLDDMKWKIAQHSQSNLIQTFSYDKQEGRLTEKLEGELLQRGVVFNKISKEDIFKKLNEWGRVNSFASFLSRFLNLYKSSAKDIELLKKESNSRRTSTFLEIFSAIYSDYEDQLHQNNLIDFNDMINQATILVGQNKDLSKFKYILVDEFQDTTQSQYRFLKALLTHNNAKLFCVGDDWQSINRFAGGDLSVMTDFESNFRNSERNLIQETHRFCDKLCIFSTKFILANPNQIKKTITSKQKDLNPAVTIVSDRTEIALEKILSKIPPNSDKKIKVLIMNRYKEIGKPSNIETLKKNNPNLSIDYSTVHRAKGLTADYAIIMGLKGGLMGFPCQIEDDPLLNLVHACHEYYPHAEERRLFYVALTRARKHVYLIVDEPSNVSQFVTEIQDNGFEVNDNLHRTKAFRCPHCKTGTTLWRLKSIVRPEDMYTGWGECSNASYCDYRPRSCPECRSGFLYKEELTFKCSNEKCTYQEKACPDCEDGHLISRTRRSDGQQFLGCSNFGVTGCRHTEELLQ
jgi:DNA helicase IV